MADAINTRVIIRRQDRIDYVLNGVCEYYGIRKDRFCSYVRNYTAVNRKKIAMKIMYDVADLRLKDIAYAMNYKVGSEHCVWDHIRNLNEDLQANNNNGKHLNAEYNKVLKHLNL
jgi:chromosomal replication initiation ATPase DnaA